MNELIRKATQSLSFVVNDIENTLAVANAIERPEGRTFGDRATSAYLADCLLLARELETKLLLIAD